MKKTDENNMILEQVRQALSQNKNTETTRLLYDFGQFLLRDHIDRSSRIDAKASTLAGYAGAALTLIASTFRLWKTDLLLWPFAHAFLFCAVLSLCLAAGLALSGRAMYGFVWFTWKDWIGFKYLTYPDVLQRHHILGMCEALLSREQMNAQKARRVLLSERALFVAGILLTAVLLAAICPSDVWNTLSRLACRWFRRLC